MDHASKAFSPLKGIFKLTQGLRLPIVSTARPFSFYNKAFWGGIDTEELSKELRTKTIIDVGCGLTPYTSDSMFQFCEREGIDFYGVDPKLDGGLKLGWLDTLKSFLTGARSKLDPYAPGLHRALPVKANSLPFDDQSVDVVLSCWLLFSWISDEPTLKEIFSEFNRVLKPGGSIRIYPIDDVASLEQRYFDLFSSLANYTLEQNFVRDFPFSFNSLYLHKLC